MKLQKTPIYLLQKNERSIKSFGVPARPISERIRILLGRLMRDRNALWGANSFQISPGRVNERRNVSFCANLKKKRGRGTRVHDFIFQGGRAVLCSGDLINSSLGTVIEDFFKIN